MIGLSRRARSQIAALKRHFLQRERPEAILNLVASIEQACDRIERQTGMVYPAPRPYPWLKAVGIRWVKQGRYWIAYDNTSGKTVIVSVLYESADIPNRL